MLCHVFWSQVEYRIVCFISQTESQSMNSCFLKNEMLLVAQTEVVHSTCVKAVEYSFQRYRSYFNLTLIYCEG